MNFLSHFYFDRNQSPEFVLGIAFPDMIGDFSKDYNRAFKNIELTNSFSKPAIDLILGVHKHYKLDAIFHNAPLFHKHCTLLKEELQNSPIKDKMPRLFIVVHILVELLLDRYLIMKNTSLIDDYYRKIEQADLTIINEVYTAIPALNHRLDFVLKRINQFKEFEFLRLYSEKKNILIALQKITLFHFPWSLNKAEDLILLNCIETYYYSNSELEFFSIFDYLTNQLH